MDVTDIGKLIVDSGGVVDIPNMDLTSPMLPQLIYGISNTTRNSIGAVNGTTRHNYRHSRLSFIPNRNTHANNIWHTFVELSGGGYFNNVGIGGRLRPVRVTVDGETQVIFEGNTAFTFMIWGNHPATRSPNGVDGLTFYSPTFDENSLEYKLNFYRGAVRFNSSLKVEYLSYFDSLTNTPLYLDYITDEELE